MVGVSILNFQDISLDSPPTHHLARTVFEKSQNVSEIVIRAHQIVEKLWYHQNAISSVYRNLSSVLSSFFPESGDGAERLGLEVDHFLKDISEQYGIFTTSLRSIILDRLEEYMTIFQDLGAESAALENLSRTRDQAYHAYMKLPQSSEMKTFHTALLELANLRLEVDRSTVLYYKNLNHAERLKEIVPLSIVVSLRSMIKQHIKDMERMLDESEMNATNILLVSLQNSVKEDSEMAAQFTDYANTLQSKDLQTFCPELYTLSLDPSGHYMRSSSASTQRNPRLNSKSGRLLLRTRTNLVWRWVNVFCHTRDGFLLSQKYDEVGASLLVDLQQKGVYVETAEYDERRNVFQIVCPTERKTVILQAESAQDRDDWIIVLTNMVFDVNSLASRLSHAGMEVSSRDCHTPTDSNVSQHTDIRTSLSPITASINAKSLWDWASTSLPSVLLELPAIPELNARRDIELVQAHQMRIEVKESNDEPTPCGSAATVDQLIVENDEIQAPLDMKFLGAVELPSMLESNDQSKLNDIFSYILSTRSSDAKSESPACRLLVTERDLWLLDSAVPQSSTDVKRADVLLHIPLANFRCWAVYPDNTKLACLIVKAPISTTPVFVSTDGYVFLTFETEHSVEIYERILGAHLRFIDLLDAEDSVKEILLSNISRLSELPDSPRTNFTLPN